MSAQWKFHYIYLKKISNKNNRGFYPHNRLSNVWWDIKFIPQVVIQPLTTNPTGRISCFTGLSVKSCWSNSPEMTSKMASETLSALDRTLDAEFHRIWCIIKAGTSRRKLKSFFGMLSYCDIRDWYQLLPVWWHHHASTKKV